MRASTILLQPTNSLLIPPKSLSSTWRRKNLLLLKRTEGCSQHWPQRALHRLCAARQTASDISSLPVPTYDEHRIIEIESWQGLVNLDMPPCGASAGRHGRGALSATPDWPAPLGHCRLTTADLSGYRDPLGRLHLGCSVWPPPIGYCPSTSDPTPLIAQAQLATPADRSSDGSPLHSTLPTHRRRSLPWPSG